MRFGLLCALCLAFAACGGGDSGPEPLTKAEYEQQAGAVLRDLAADPESFTPDTFDDDVQAAADALGALSPPDEIRDLHVLLADGLEGLAGDLRAAAEAMDDPEALQRALDRIAASPGGKQAEDALRELVEKGYRLPSVFGPAGVGQADD